MKLREAFDKDPVKYISSAILAVFLCINIGNCFTESYHPRHILHVFFDAALILNIWEVRTRKQLETDTGKNISPSLHEFFTVFAIIGTQGGMLYTSPDVGNLIASAFSLYIFYLLWSDYRREKT